MRIIDEDDARLYAKEKSFLKDQGLSLLYRPVHLHKAPSQIDKSTGNETESISRVSNQICSIFQVNELE